MATGNRKQVRKETIENVIDGVKAKLYLRLEEKGWGGLTSTHEILGMIQEEHHELVRAVQDGEREPVMDECLDIAVAAIFALVCDGDDTLDW